MDTLLAENQRLSSRLDEARAPSPAASPLAQPEPAAAEHAKEFERLRAEVEALRRQTAEAESLQVDTRRLQADRESAMRKQGANASSSSTPDGSQFEILQADYWTDKTNLDVAAELRDRIRGDTLKAVASNNLKSDPDFGTVKHLTVVYRLHGVTLTNEFQEGDVIILPKE